MCQGGGHDEATAGGATWGRRGEMTSPREGRTGEAAGLGGQWKGGGWVECRCGGAVHAACGGRWERQPALNLGGGQDCESAAHLRTRACVLSPPIIAALEVRGVRPSELGRPVRATTAAVVPVGYLCACEGSTRVRARVRIRVRNPDSG